MHKVSGGCHCGNIVVDLELARPPDRYNPRACDCDFCRKHCASYISDAEGALLIHIKHESNSGNYRQGSGTAEFLLCRNCGVLVGALYRSDQHLYGTVNAKMMDANFGTEQSVWPETLSGSGKIARWKDIWFANVKIVSVDA